MCVEIVVVGIIFLIILGGVLIYNASQGNLVNRVLVNDRDGHGHGLRWKEI